MRERMECRRIFYTCFYVWLCLEVFVTQAKAEFCFDANNEGRRLNTSVLRKVYTLSGPACVLRCLNDNCCRSVNYNKRCSSSESKDNCELLHDVASEQPQQLKFDKNFDHLILLQPSRIFNCSCVSCEKSEKCFEEFKNCSCAFGFDGDKCIEADISCGTYNWWANSNYTNSWSNCPSFSPFMSGLKRTAADSANLDKLVSIVEKKCCNVTKIDVQSECKIDNRWRRSLDRTNEWSRCPDGYFLNGLRSSHLEKSGLASIDDAECCKLKEFPEKYSDCYEEDVSKSFHYTQAGMSQCSKERHFIAGLYKAGCNYIYCITKFWCCRMVYI